MQKYSVPLIVGFVILTLWWASPAAACTGQVTFEDWMENADAFVKARVLSVDDTGGNVRLQVETYLSGTGVEHIILFENSIGEINTPSFVPCGWGVKSISSNTPVGGSIYLPLYQTFVGGVYQTSRVYYFPEPGSTVYELFDRRDPKSRTLTEAELIDAVAEFTGDEPSEPISNTPPLPAVLRIRTEDGGDYLLSPDGSAPVTFTPYELIHFLNGGLLENGTSEGNLSEFVSAYTTDDPCGDNVDCYVFSPDYVHLRRRVDRDGNPVRFLFSPRGDALALWRENSIEIQSHTDVIAQTSTLPEALGAWSPNGQVLAFSDQRGLWLWNIEHEPELLIPADAGQIAVARHFSPSGRYLSVDEGGSVAYIDLVSGERLPDGLFSPDERRLLVYDTQAGTPTPLTECMVESMICAETPTYETLGDPVWLNNETFLINGCSTAIEECFVRLSSNLYPLNEAHDNHRLFTYQAGTELVAILHADGRLDIMKREMLSLRPMMQVNLSLDSPVVSLEWLPSFFYDFTEKVTP